MAAEINALDSAEGIGDKCLTVGPADDVSPSNMRTFFPHIRA